MPQTLTGAAGLASTLAFGLSADGHLIQQLITGAVGLGSTLTFATPSGVRIDPFTVPVTRQFAY